MLLLDHAQICAACNRDRELYPALGPKAIVTCPGHEVSFPSADLASTQLQLAR